MWCLSPSMLFSVPSKSMFAGVPLNSIDQPSDLFSRQASQQSDSGDICFPFSYPVVRSSHLDESRFQHLDGLTTVNIEVDQQSSNGYEQPAYDIQHPLLRFTHGRSVKVYQSLPPDYSLSLASFLTNPGAKRPSGTWHFLSYRFSRRLQAYCVARIPFDLQRSQA